MRTTSSDTLRAKLLGFQQGRVCPECNGKRLSPYARSVLINNLSIGEFLSFPLGRHGNFYDPIKKMRNYFPEFLMPTTALSRDSGL